jgi:hypothetical protein
MTIDGDIVGPRSVFAFLTRTRQCSVGDKSPKSKDKQKKQDKAHKDQKKADANAKATPDPAKPFKGGK